MSEFETRQVLVIVSNKTVFVRTISIIYKLANFYITKFTCLFFDFEFLPETMARIAVKIVVRNMLSWT